MKQLHRSLLQFLTLIAISIGVLLFPSGNGKSVFGSSWNAYPVPDPVKGSLSYTYKINLPAIMSADIPPEPPNSSISRYIYSDDWTYLHDTAGCAEGTAANPNAFVFLDFGYPWIDTSTNPPSYGVLLLSGIKNLRMNEIEAAAKNYLQGYYACAPSGAHISVAIGLNNYGDNTQLNSTVGQEWAAMIKRVNDWVLQPPSWGDKIVVYGAVDIEPSFGVPNDIIGWIQGYDAYPGRQNYYNFGSCDSCPYIYGNQDHSNWQLPNGWNQDQLWYATYGLLSAHVIPEIYTREDAPETPINYYPAHEAYQWQNLKYWGATCSNGCIPSYPPFNAWRNIFFSGVLTQYDACNDPGNPQAQTCRNNYQDNSPAQGWVLFWNALASNTITKQNFSFSTDISWKH